MAGNTQPRQIQLIFRTCLKFRQGGAFEPFILLSTEFFCPGLNRLHHSLGPVQAGSRVTPWGSDAGNLCYALTSAVMTGSLFLMVSQASTGYLLRVVQALTIH